MKSLRGVCLRTLQALRAKVNKLLLLLSQIKYINRIVQSIICFPDFGTPPATSVQNSAVPEIVELRVTSTNEAPSKSCTVKVRFTLCNFPECFISFIFLIFSFCIVLSCPIYFISFSDLLQAPASTPVQIVQLKCLL